ncbi:MAG TPA: hypothetical protein DCE78_08860 [Bacteroidetes bacterium]|nr:hypothetical protein [Bacteroidota bacterium]
MRSDLYQLTTIIKEKGFRPKGFLEVGSRDGHDAKYIAEFFAIPPKNVYIIEPHPDHFKQIISRYPDYNSYNFAASNEAGLTQFNAGKIGEELNPGKSSILSEKNRFIANTIMVQTNRLDSWLSSTECVADIIKIDVEGYSWEVLVGLKDQLSKFQYIQIELEKVEVWKGQYLRDSCVELMNSFGWIVTHEVDIQGLGVQCDILFEKVHL